MTDGHKLCVVGIEMEVYAFVFTINVLRGDVYRENNRGPKTEP